MARVAGRRVVAPVPGGWGLLQARLALAVPAPHRRPLADLRLLQRPAAVRAGGAAAAVRAQLMHEIARCAVRGEEVAQRGAAAGDGVFEDAPYCVGEQAAALARDLRSEDHTSDLQSLTPTSSAV